jgi:3-hydroxyisobutyrate dehydrogenase-like beta-hydroxyacid dehydrogenase
MADAPTSVGFVGLGHMGGNMAARFVGAGYRIDGTNRTRDRTRALIEDGVRWRDTPRQVAAAADVPLPTADRTAEILDAARQLGYERRDNAARFQVVEQMSAQQATSA